MTGVTRMGPCAVAVLQPGCCSGSPQRPIPTGAPPAVPGPGPFAPTITLGLALVVVGAWMPVWPHPARQTTMTRRA